MQTRADVPGRILVVDDEESIRDLLTRVLSNAGHRVTVAETGAAALAALAKARFDLVVLDKNLPDMGGLDVLRLVRSEYPGTFAIMITAYPSPGSEAAARALGVHSFIVKPFGILDIVRAVDDAIRAP